MKQKFSKKWKASKQPRKQRKYLANAPLHIQRKMLGATLSKELRKKYGMRNIVVRKGDEVKVMGGKFRKKTGKVSIVEAQKIRIAIEGLQRTKKDGAKVEVWFHPSNVMITLLNLDDRKRMKRGKGRAEKEIEKKEKKVEEKNKEKGKEVKKKIETKKINKEKENVSKKK